MTVHADEELHKPFNKPFYKPFIKSLSCSIDPFLTSPHHYTPSPKQQCCHYLLEDQQ